MNGIIAVLSPLLGFIIAGTVGQFIKEDRIAQFTTCILMFVAMCASVHAFYYHTILGHTETMTLFSWMQTNTFNFEWGIRLDALSTTMMCVVTIVSFLVHVYSLGYMAHDESIPRFMGYLSLFTFTMMALITAPNLLQLFFGWEGVGLASYLLIGFWYEKPSANAAAIKAFIVNRVADTALVVGLCALFYMTNSLNFNDIFSFVSKVDVRPTIQAGYWTFDWINMTCLLLFLGAMGKSAQFGFHVWLPDAMEGPTPVSALIHAATMVTAGIFLVVRMHPLFNLSPDVMNFIVIIGAITAFFAATVGLVQNDIKRIIAYSTCSQLGYMFFACGCGAYSLGLFHLVTHAFFKSLLFLGAGSVIHAMSDEQDIWKMGGIRKHIPFTYSMMWIGSLALCGIPFFAGYYSKDAILQAAYNSPFKELYWVGWISAIMTGFYSARLIYVTFHGKPRADDRVMAHVHESPKTMTIPLALLSVGAIISGYALYPLFSAPNNPYAPYVLREIPHTMELVTLLAGVIGIAVSFFVYRYLSTMMNWLAKSFRYIYEFILNKWYVDEIYNALIVSPLSQFSTHLWNGMDTKIIDNLGPNKASDLSMRVSLRLKSFHTGRIYHYALALLMGIILCLWWLEHCSKGL
jgi:NADH-quinone oxidoreductase subunit L